jgi:DNA invertase Pin-like site-specific DNA recombinase
MIERHPVAYIRRSVASRADPGDVSRDFQTEAVRKLAGNDPALVILAGDWGKSAATDKTARRLIFLEMMESIERGEVSTLYAYSADRLARSVEWSARLLNACRRAGVTIVTNEGRFAPEDDAAIDLFNFRAVVNESVLRQMERKAKSSVAARERRGDAMGRSPYGTRHEKIDGKIVTVPDPSKPLAPLLDAYAEGGSVFAAVRLLNAAKKVPLPRGHYCIADGRVPGCCHPKLNAKSGNLECSCGLWHPTVLRNILERNGVRLPQPGPTGRRVPGRGSALAHLCLCHCGHALSQNLARHALFCSRGQVTRKSHGPYYIAEKALMPLVREEMEHLDVPDAYSVAETHEAERSALLERRRRLAILFADGLLEDEEYRSELTGITRALDDLGDASYIVDVPGIDWDAPVADVNEALRAFLARIELDATMRPAAYIWRVPSMRKE